jgi:glycerate dehydrogenase
VAQYVFAAVLHVWHNISGHDAAVKAGEWGRQSDWSFWKTPLIELRGQTMGIVGFGRIGRRVGELAHAFGMNVLAYDTFPGAHPGFTPFAWAVLEEVFSRSDVVSLHCPLTSENQRFVNRELLQRMKPTSLFINASRGSLVNEGDLAAALKAGWIAGAVVDVVSAEPIRPENPLLSAANIVMTPHLAWAAQQARQRLMRTTAENVQAFLEGRPQNLVNGRFLGK